MRPKRNEDIETKLLPDGHVVLFSTKSDWAHTITPLAAVAWEYCDGKNSIEEIVRNVTEVAKNNDVFASLDPNEFETTVINLVKELETHGLVAEGSTKQS